MWRITARSNCACSRSNPGSQILRPSPTATKRERLAQSDAPEQTYINEIMPEKLAMNLEYLATRNTPLDLRVFLETVAAVLGDQSEKKHR